MGYFVCALTKVYWAAGKLKNRLARLPVPFQKRNKRARLNATKGRKITYQSGRIS